MVYYGESLFAGCWVGYPLSPFAERVIPANRQPADGTGIECHEYRAANRGKFRRGDVQSLVDSTTDLSHGTLSRGDSLHGADLFEYG